MTIKFNPTTITLTVTADELDKLHTLVRDKRWNVVPGVVAAAVTSGDDDGAKLARAEALMGRWEALLDKLEAASKPPSGWAIVTKAGDFVRGGYASEADAKLDMDEDADEDLNCEVRRID